MSFALPGYIREVRGVGIEGNAMGTKKRRIQDVYISEKCIIHQRLRIRRLDGEKDGRATARIYRIALALSGFLIQSWGISSTRAHLTLISVRRFLDGCGDAEAQRLK
jgi:hypothetical protein